MKKFLSVIGLLLAFGSVVAQTQGNVTKEVLGDHNGSEICLYTLTNKAGNLLKLTNYGARIVGIFVPDKNGVKENVTPGGDKLQTIVNGDAFGGATVGRYANRIANGKFTLDDHEYNLPINNRPNTLHSGPNGWYSKVWNAEIVPSRKQAMVKFTYLSPDMESGFPGTVTVSVTYTWNDKNEIIIDYDATTDKKTVVNFTNHAYFNLNGLGKGYIFNEVLTIKASSYTPLNATKIPIGEIRPVKGTPYDFTTPHSIGYMIGETYQGAVFQGYDDNYVLDRKGKVCATVYDTESGRQMEVITDQPGLQFYSGFGGMMWKKSQTSGEKPQTTRSAFALETQHFPDSPNQPGFPSTVLNPGERFKSRTIYRFSVRKE